VGTLNGSELSPSVGAVAPVTDVLDEEEGVSVTPVTSAPCVGPMVADAAKPVVLDVGLTGPGHVPRPQPQATSSSQI
jgi:hypothetical protein